MLRKVLKITLAGAMLLLPAVVMGQSQSFKNAENSRNSGNYSQAKKQYQAALADPGNASKKGEIMKRIKECDKKISGASAPKVSRHTKSNSGTSTTYSAPKPASTLTVNGSANPSLTLSADGGQRSVTIAHCYDDPDVYGVPSWMWVTDVDDDSMTILWDDNDTPNARNDYFFVTDGLKTIRVNVSQPKGTSKNLQITKARFANTRGQSILTDFGETLYADDMRFLTTELTYNGLKNTVTKRVNVKIFNPNGTLRTTDYSHSGYTTSEEIDFEPGWNNYDYLLGVGRSDCSIYDAGMYKIEIYVEDDLVQTSNLYLNAKGGATSYLTIDNEDTYNSYFIARGETLELEVRTDGSWTTMDLPEWCTAAKQGNKLMLTAKPNTGSYSRTHCMKVVSGNRTLPITLRQEGKL